MYDLVEQVRREAVSNDDDEREPDEPAIVVLGSVDGLARRDQPHLVASGTLAAIKGANGSVWISAWYNVR